MILPMVMSSLLPDKNNFKDSVEIGVNKTRKLNGKQ